MTFEDSLLRIFAILMEKSWGKSHVLAVIAIKLEKELVLKQKKIEFFLEVDVNTSICKTLDIFGYLDIFLGSDIQAQRGKDPREVKNWKKIQVGDWKKLHTIWFLIFQRIRWIESIFVKPWDFLPLLYSVIQPPISYLAAR